MMICPDCGARWTADDVRCPGCGLTWQEMEDAAAFLDGIDWIAGHKVA